MNESDYGKPIDKNSAHFKAFSKKKFFKIEEFACLLAEIDPVSFDDSLKAASVFLVKVGPFVDLLKEEEKYISGEDFLDDDYYEFCGYKRESERYPVRAYEVFCDMKGIDFPLDRQPNDKLNKHTLLAYSKSSSVSVWDFACLMAGYNPGDYIGCFHEQIPCEIFEYLKMIESHLEKRYDIDEIDISVPF